MKNRRRHFYRLFSYLLVLAIANIGVSETAQAGMVPTTQAVQSSQSQAERAKLNIFLQREDVVAALEHAGVNPTQVQARVNNLTDREILSLSNRIDQLPAGGDDALGDVLGAAVFVFIVLLITDLLGFTDVFPFVHHPNQ